MGNLEKTLEERGSRYGVFALHAEMTQAVKSIMRGVVPDLSEECSTRLALAWELLSPDQKESLEMNAHKIGRILNGDPDYSDSWADIAGYAKLVADRLEGVENDKLAKAVVGSGVSDRDVCAAKVGRAEVEATKTVFGASATKSAVRGGQRSGAKTGKATHKR